MIMGNIPTQPTGGNAIPTPDNSITVTPTPAPPAAQPALPASTSTADTSTLAKAEALVQSLAPTFAAIFGPPGAAGAVLAEMGLEAANVVYELHSKHHSLLSTHKTLPEAVQAAVKHVHFRQPGVLASRRNPTTWTIHPVIQLSVADILKHPAPVGSLAKDIDVDDED